ncbi:MAG: hypothetical protein U1E39_06670 [Planctomycetota bacterium]
MDPSRPAPYLTRIAVDPRRVSDASAWPFTMPWVPGLSLEVRHAVTFFVGENGSGKSTLVEGLAEACGLPVAGGGVHELPDGHGPEVSSALGRALRPGFRARPHDKSLSQECPSRARRDRREAGRRSREAPEAGS